MALRASSPPASKERSCCVACPATFTARLYYAPSTPIPSSILHSFLPHSAKTARPSPETACRAYLPPGLSTVYPLIHAMTTQAVDAPGALVKRSTEEWGSRALVEAALLHLRATGPGKL